MIHAIHSRIKLLAVLSISIVSYFMINYISSSKTSDIAIATKISGVNTSASNKTNISSTEHRKNDNSVIAKDEINLEQVVISDSRFHKQSLLFKSVISLETLKQSISLLNSSNNNDLLLLLEKIWRDAADLGAPDFVLTELELLVNSSDINIATKATQILNDLYSVKNGKKDKLTLNDIPAYLYDDTIKRSANNSEVDNLLDDKNSIVSTYNSDDEEIIKNSQTKAIFKHFENLYNKAIYEKNINKRAAAINQLSNHRNKHSIDTLIITSMDAEAEIRYLSVNSLWKIAADGLDNDGQIHSIIKTLVNDPDAQVSESANIALDDINNILNKSKDTNTNLTYDNSDLMTKRLSIERL